MSLSLKYIGNEILRRRAKPVTEFGPALEAHLPEMIRIMREEGGIGLAAPQAGISQHFFVVVANVDDEERQEDEIMLMANVKLLESSRTEITMEEGCLSIPGLRTDLSRPERVRVAFDDIHGARGELETDGVLARAIQHELDHCEGILFVDRLSPARRAVLRKKISEIESEYAGA